MEHILQRFVSDWDRLGPHHNFKSESVHGKFHEGTIIISTSCWLFRR